MIFIEKKNSNGVVILPPDALTNDKALEKQAKYCNDSTIKAVETHFNKPSVVKTLEKIYKNKCCYCEQPVRKYKPKAGEKSPDYSRAIEHFRPKEKYNWLAYSWDNLLLICERCNNLKDNNFPILNTRITQAQESDLTQIHTLATTYNELESPLFPHPEIDDPTDFLVFDRIGQIYSNKSAIQTNTISSCTTCENSENCTTCNRYDYMIQQCELYREALILSRKPIYDKFIAEFKQILISADNPITQKQEILNLIDSFKLEQEDTSKPFLGFRRFLYKTLIEPIRVHYQ